MRLNIMRLTVMISAAIAVLAGLVGWLRPRRRQTLVQRMMGTGMEWMRRSGRLDIGNLLYRPAVRMIMRTTRRMAKGMIR